MSPRSLIQFFSVTPVCFCARTTMHLSPIVTLWNNVLISLCSSANTQTSHLSTFSHGFLMLSTGWFLVKLYICLIPDVCYWTIPSQRSTAGVGGALCVCVCWFGFGFFFWTDPYFLRHHSSCSLSPGLTMLPVELFLRCHIKAVTASEDFSN